jgi:CheY-like chemotaxis protein
MSTGVPQAETTIPSGLHILVVEDELMLAMMLEDLLKAFGCIPLMAARIEKALQLVATTAFDVALLDVNIAGDAVYPVARELDRRGVPFVFVTGYSDRGLHADYRDRPALSKPFSSAALGEALAAALASRESTGQG